MNYNFEETESSAHASTSNDHTLMLPVPIVPFKAHENIAPVSVNTSQSQDIAPQNLVYQIDNPFQVEQPTAQLEPPTAQLEHHDEPPVRRSQRARKSTIPADHMVYLQEVEFDIGDENDPKSFDQAMKSAQAPLWHKAMLEELNSMAKNENKLDDCIYLEVDKSRFIFLFLYVDDILLASSDFQLLLETKTMLSNSFDMKDLGEAHYVLGIEIMRNRSRKLLGLSQLNYINKVLKRFNMEACSPGDLPIGKGDRPSKDQCPMTEQEQANMKNKPYASLVGSLMYAQVCTRPDLSFAVSVLGRFQANPGEPHWVLAKKVLRYLKKTKSLMLIYGHVDNLELTCYSDSDLAGCVDDRKSTSGYIFLLAGGAVSWRSKKQNSISTSTMEAEFIGCFEATRQGLWIKIFVTDMKLVANIDKPLKIYCDNNAAIYFAKNNKRSSASRIMDVKYLSLQDKVKEGIVEVEYIITHSMLADPLTKALDVGVFQDFVMRIGLHESFDSV
ncbi:unnamed protein product [Prunus brigantina]